MAIDFGTHGSGFAWATVSNLQDITNHRYIAYQDFVADGGSSSYPKDLTAVLVDAHRIPMEFGFEARRRWQNELSRGNPNGLGYATRFKMALRADAPPADVPRFLGNLVGADSQVVRGLIAAYLGKVYRTALSEIEATGYRGIGFDADDIRWCITVPAIWKDNEKRVMREAAEAAGMPPGDERLLLVSEPEAAAVYCALTPGTLLGSERPEGALDVERAGSRFMVVDCGGGTVDITSYQIRSEGVGDSRLTEIGIADGGPLGSAYINQQFVDQVLADRFGAEKLKALKVSHSREIARLEDRWEEWKVGLHSETAPDGTPSITTPCDIEVPGRLWEALPKSTRQRLTELAFGDPYHIVVTPEEVTAVHEVVVGPVLDTIERQRHLVIDGGPVKGVDQIVIVGGFARSSYLRDRIAQRFGAKVRVLMPQDPAVAVLGGAVHFAYDPAVIWGRRSKYTYGFQTAMPFRDGVDPKGKRFVDDDGDILCADRFNVVVIRGEHVRADEVVETSLSVMRRSVRTFDIGLFATFSDDPQYVDEEGCERVGTVTADVSGSVGLPSSERQLDVYYAFGGTEIVVETRDRVSDVRRKATIEFTELYGRRGKAGD
ncbi:Hsp70 family protein [Streptomyces bicolor]|uniref:Hsp70 family protein n=1 Tax=Streptomyces bicolor TaxID=66874 RepID=UPI00131C75AA|nr:Hsp70 family protein [Streptomyces bicolor]